ncbi:MAG TPA: hypothetical protein VI461_17285 [Chitinophagaceae bacterium]|nr:hypothetical protein [Chitinophagaceae bacterium]
MFISETQLCVRYAETDQTGVVYHSNFFPYFEPARAEPIRQSGFTCTDMEKMRVIERIADNCQNHFVFYGVENDETNDDARTFIEKT